jgi:hypothetical protein
MNTLLLVVLASCPPGGDPGYPQAPAPVASSPDTGTVQGGSNHQGRPSLFGWLRGHRHKKSSSAGNGDGAPMAPAPSPAGWTGPVVEAMPPEPAPTVMAPPALAGPAPRMVAPAQAVMTSAEPPLADPPAPVTSAPRLVPIPAR